MTRSVLAAILALAIFAQPLTPQTKKRKVLAIGDVHRKVYQHDVVSHALSTIERLRYQSGLFDTYIRTDIQSITKHPIDFAEKVAVPDTQGRVENYLTLNDFDAIVFFGLGELELTEQQKADMLAFVKEDGKGFVGIHTALNSFLTWPEYGEMIGGYFDDHPWLIFNAPVLVEDGNFPAMKGFPKAFTSREEIYQVRNFSRDRVRVLARLDPSKLDLDNPRVHRKDNDFAVAWAREYGKGRVFYSSFGHTPESWDDPAMQKMWLEAIKWSMGMTPGDATPRPLK